MSLYKVKGSDGGVYGPVLSVVVQQWIAEGRLNGDSVLSVDDTDWRPLQEFPEFAGSLAAAAAAAAASAAASASGAQGVISGWQAAVAQAKTPGLLLILLGSLMGIFTLVSMVMLVTQSAGGAPAVPTLPPNTPEWLQNFMQMQANMPKWVSWAQLVMGVLVDALMVVGGLHLMRLGNRGLAMAAGIVAMVPCFTSCRCVLGLPLGIWVVMTCSAPTVRPHFKA